MTRKNAIIALLTLPCCRAVAQEKMPSAPIPPPSPIYIFEPTEFKLEPSQSKLTFRLEAPDITFQLDGRTVTLTAKEIADALGAK